LALDRVIKEKKQAISDAELAKQKLTIDVQNLNKDLSAANSTIKNLEQEHDWIQDEKE
jgi:structural maintenance of chromosome 2